MIDKPIYFFYILTTINLNKFLFIKFFGKFTFKMNSQIPGAPVKSGLSKYDVSELWELYNKNRAPFVEPGLQRPVKPRLTGVRKNPRTLAELYGNSIDECPGAPRKKGRCGEREEARNTWDD